MAEDCCPIQQREDVLLGGREAAGDWGDGGKVAEGVSGYPDCRVSGRVSEDGGGEAGSDCGCCGEASGCGVRGDGFAQAGVADGGDVGTA